MQIRIFTLPVISSRQSEDELNRFLRSHRVLQVERHFCPDNGGYWAVLVEYVDGDPVAEAPPASRREKKDFSKELDGAALQRFEHFKHIRREIASTNNIPAYLVFTNEELALLAKMPPLTEENTRQVKGIAPQRLKDYVRYFIETGNGEESGTSDGADSQQGQPF